MLKVHFEMAEYSNTSPSLQMERILQLYYFVPWVGYKVQQYEIEFQSSVLIFLVFSIYYLFPFIIVVVRYMRVS